MASVVAEVFPTHCANYMYLCTIYCVPLGVGMFLRVGAGVAPVRTCKLLPAVRVPAECGTLDQTKNSLHQEIITIYAALTGPFFTCHKGWTVPGVDERSRGAPRQHGRRSLATQSVPAINVGPSMYVRLRRM